MMKKIFVALAFSIGYSFLLACQLASFLSILSLSMSIFENWSDYPRFTPFCFAVIIISLILIVGLLYINSKYWNHSLKSHDTEFLIEIIGTCILVFPFWSVLDKAINWTHSAF